MSSAEVCGFILKHEPKESVAEALVLFRLIFQVGECRARWDEMNKQKKTNSKIGDLPYLKFGCDDITAVVAYFTFIDELEDNYFQQKY